MITLLDGPAAGHVLRLARAPRFLRVVIDRENPNNIDGLDQFNDVPRSFEEIHAYALASEPALGHVDYRDKDGQRRSDNIIVAIYSLCADQPDDETMRDYRLWREWCQDRAKTEEGVTA